MRAVVSISLEERSTSQATVLTPTMPKVDKADEVAGVVMEDPLVLEAAVESVAQEALESMVAWATLGCQVSPPAVMVETAATEVREEMEAMVAQAARGTKVAPEDGHRAAVCMLPAGR